ncbi:MAG: SDR family NAD(P)-dependent oxidoreductase [Anaerolineaceae bacterium]|nr:SDR family NAD(P)-dependent oxidoreductase [Anaerolineaceae bacterium]
MSELTILITGASRGLGAAAARAAGQLGANVVLTARSAGDLEAVAADVQEAGGQALAVPGDVSRPEDDERIVAAAIERFGALDALVNNAGILGPVSPIAEAEAGAWNETWAINVLGPVILTRAALPHLRERKGRVINVSSGAAVSPVPGWGAYCLTKAAVTHLTRMVAAEEPDVTAISFRPGVVDTAMQATIRSEGAAGMPREEYERFVAYHRQGELLPPAVPGCALAVLAFYAPPSWSGAFLSWDEGQVQSLVRRYACSARS